MVFVSWEGVASRVCPEDRWGHCILWCSGASVSVVLAGDNVVFGVSKLVYKYLGSTSLTGGSCARYIELKEFGFLFKCREDIYSVGFEFRPNTRGRIFSFHLFARVCLPFWADRHQFTPLILISWTSRPKVEQVAGGGPLNLQLEATLL